MSDTTDVPNVTVLKEKKPSRFSKLNTKAVKVATAIAVGALGVVYVKNKLNGSCSVNADVHVETADNDNPDN